MAQPLAIRRASGWPAAQGWPPSGPGRPQAAVGGIHDNLFTASAGAPAPARRTGRLGLTALAGSNTASSAASAMKDVGRSGKAPPGPVHACWRYANASTSSHAHARAARSQFWSQLSPFVGVRERSTGRFASVNGGVRISLDLGLRIWKAGWVQALAGSNPASSAIPTRGNADADPYGWRSRTGIVSIVASIGIVDTLPLPHSRPPIPVGHITPNRIRHQYTQAVITPCSTEYARGRTCSDQAAATASRRPARLETRGPLRVSTFTGKWFDPRTAETPILNCFPRTGRVRRPTSAR
jgi:hypothetical protein